MQNQRTEVNNMSTSDMVNMGNDLQDLVPRQRVVLKRTTLRVIGIIQMIALIITLIVSIVFIGISHTSDPRLTSVGVWAGCVAFPGAMMMLVIAFSNRNPDSIQCKDTLSIVMNTVGAVACLIGEIFNVIGFMAFEKVCSNAGYHDYHVFKELCTLVKALLGIHLFATGCLALMCLLSAVYACAGCCDTEQNTNPSYVFTAPLSLAPSIFMQTSIDQQNQCPQQMLPTFSQMPPTYAQIPPTYAQVPFQRPSQPGNEIRISEAHANPVFR